jgi:hypothetical protein
MKDPGSPENSLAVVLRQLAQSDAAALRTIRAGDQRELCEISERLLRLHLRFAAEYRSMLAAGPGVLAA